MGGKARRKGGGKGGIASRQSRSGDTDIGQNKATPKPDESAGILRGRSRLSFALVFVFAFLLAFFLAWLLFRNSSRLSDAPPPRPPAPEAGFPFTDPITAPVGAASAGGDGGIPVAPSRSISRAELERILAAADADDFDSLEKIGVNLFAEGNTAPDHKDVFLRYRVDSPPPYITYAFMSGVIDGHVVRVMLTVDDAGAVVSYMAEKLQVVE